MGNQRAVRTLVAILCACVIGACGGGGGGSDAANSSAPGKTSTTAAGKTGPTTGGGTTTTAEEGRGDDIPDEPAKPSGPTTDLVRVQDPVNRAFAVDVPRGWENLVYSTVEGQTHHEVVDSISPDGRTVLFIGDPKIPSYWNPDLANPITIQFADQLDFMDLGYYTPAPDYMPTYVEKKFGKLPSFKIDGSAADTAAEAKLRGQFVAAGVPEPTLHIQEIRFSYAGEDGGRMRGVVVGATIDSGPFWQVMVQGLSTDGDPDDFLPMLSAMARSQKTDDAFIAGQNARHQQVLAEIQRRTDEMTRQHQANMAWIQDSANAHQQRMQALWAANDASVESFYDRMASSDSSHRQFLNYINDENTVANSSGQRFQVDNSYQTYYMNKNDKTYVGGDINFGDTQLRALGLNPDDYEQVEVVK